MKKIKKLTAFLTALCMMIGSAAFAVACGDSGDSSSNASSSESSQSTSSEEIQKATITITLQKEDGTKVEGVQFTFKKGKVTERVTTDAEGKAVFTGALGEYTIRCSTSTLPDLHTPLDWQTTQTVDLTQDVSFTFTLEDLTPDGSPEKPFSVGADDTGVSKEVKIPANATYHYILYATLADNLVVENSNVQIANESTTYNPVNGIVIMPITLDGTHDNMSFTLTNTSSSEISIVIKLTSNSVEGSIFNPLALTPNTQLTAEKLVTSDDDTDTDTVYYKWTATADGTLSVTTPLSSIATSDIVLENSTTSYVSDGWTLTVNEGDVVYVIVSLEELDSLAFTANFS